MFWENTGFFASPPTSFVSEKSVRQAGIPGSGDWESRELQPQSVHCCWRVKFKVSLEREAVVRTWKVIYMAKNLEFAFK